MNELFRIMGQQNATQPSPIMGFVPSEVWHPVKDADEYIKSLGANPAKVREILREMRDLSLSAIVADSGSIVRVVRVGIGNKESGLLFASGDAAPYKKGEKLGDGREILLIERMKQGCSITRPTDQSDCFAVGVSTRGEELAELGQATIRRA